MRLRLVFRVSFFLLLTLWTACCHGAVPYYGHGPTVRFHRPWEPRTKTIVLPGGVKLELVRCRAHGNNKNFWIGKYEITQAQWEGVMGCNPSHFKGAGRPVENVSWNDCQEFCSKAGFGLRLPTDAEWECASQCGRGFPAVANVWGIRNLHDSVSEWCSDSLGADDGEATCDVRIYRGDSWKDDTRCGQDNAKFTWSARHAAAFRADNLGFRVCMTGNAWDAVEDWHPHWRTDIIKAIVMVGALVLIVWLLCRFVTRRK